MKEIGRYNKLSKEFIEQLKEEGALRMLEPGQTATFRYAEERFDPTDKTRTKVIYPSSVKVPSTCQIYDPFAKTVVDIGVVQTVDSNGNADRVIRRTHQLDRETGEFILSGNSEEDQYLYWFYQLCDWNRSNKRRNQAEQPKFYEVNRDAESKAVLERRSKRLEAELYVSRLGKKDLVMLDQAVGGHGTESESVLRRKLWDFAMKNPDLFENLMRDSKTIESRSIVKKAIDLGIIRFNEVERTVTLADSGTVIATLARVEGKQMHEQLDEFFKTSVQGEKKFETIKKLVAMADKKGD